MINMCRYEVDVVFLLMRSLMYIYCDDKLRLDIPGALTVYIYVRVRHLHRIPIIVIIVLRL